jgi:hypothetical protein
MADGNSDGTGSRAITADARTGTGTNNRSQYGGSPAIPDDETLHAPLAIPGIYAARRLSEVLPALSASLGHPVPTALVADPEKARLDLGLPHASSIVIALIDGLGYWNLALCADHAPYLASLLGEGTWIRTCYPTTTTAAMATFGTGTCPGLTGLLGYTQLNPRTGRITQMIQWKGAIPPEELQRQPTVFTGLVGQQVRTDSISMPEFKKSPMTRASLAGPRFLKRKTSTERLDLAIELTHQPGLTYFYLRDVDHTGHADGWESDDWAQALENVDDQLRRLHEQAAPGTLLVVVADHGMVSAASSARIDIAGDPELCEGVHLIGGEPRAVMVYKEDGEYTDRLAARWREALGDAARVFTRDEAVSSGLFGPVEERIRPMIGDLVVLANGHTTIVDSRFESIGAMSMPGVHGSWTEMESRIPLLVDVS